MLRSNPVDWLLEANNPSVRYFTLIDLLDMPQNDPQVDQANITERVLFPGLDGLSRWQKRYYTPRE